MSTYGDTWNDDAKIAVRQYWSTDSNLYTTISMLESVNYALQSERNRGFELLSKITRSQLTGDNGKLVSKKNRFSDEDVYVHLFDCDMPNLLGTLRLCLEYKPPENAFMINNDSGKTAVSSSRATSGRIEHQRNAADDEKNDANNIKDISEREKFEKSKVAYKETLVKIVDNAYKKCGIYTQTTFEKKFQLKWSGN